MDTPNKGIYDLALMFHCGDKIYFSMKLRIPPFNNIARGPQNKAKLGIQNFLSFGNAAWNLYFSLLWLHSILQVMCL